MRKDFQDRIDDYILNRMSVEENIQFEAEVNQDESKKEELEFTRNVKSAISSRQSKLTELRKMKMTYEKEQEQLLGQTACVLCDSETERGFTNKKTTKRFWGWWGVGIAASLLVGLFVINPFKYNPTSTAPSSGVMLNDADFVFGAKKAVDNKSMVHDTILSDTIAPYKKGEKYK